MNCGSAEHQSRDCTKAQVPREQRPCWRCGLPGHIGAQCKAGKPTHLCDDNEPDHTFCVTEADGEGYTRVGGPQHRGPRPATLADFMPTNAVTKVHNKYHALEETDSEENDYDDGNSLINTCIDPNCTFNRIFSPSFLHRIH